MEKLIVCVDLNNESLELIKKDLNTRPLDHFGEIHIVHVFQTQVYADNFYFCTYPLESEYEKIKASVEEILKGIEDEIKQKSESLSVYTKCIISKDPKDSIIDYVNEKKAKCLYIATRGKHGITGLFSSSFAEHMVRYAPCELLVIRPNHD